MDLRLEKVSVGYRDRPVLKEVGFTAKAGEITAIVGANAVGKSTLLKSVVGVIPSKGEMYFGDKLSTQYTAHEHTHLIGYLMQENMQAVSLTVFEMVLLGRMNALNLRVSDDELDCVMNVLQSLDIAELAQRKFSELSGGQRRIVSIAQTIVSEPTIFILDEPTANLDMQNELEVLELIRDYTQEHHVTTLVTLHDLNLAARYADRLLLLYNGGVYSSGVPRDVLNEKTIRVAYGVEARVLVGEDGIPQISPIRSTKRGK